MRPFISINGLAFLVTSGVCFSLRVEGSVGLIYILLFIVGSFMATIYSLNIPIENNNEDKLDSIVEDNAPKYKGVLYKFVPTVVSVVMCAVMVVQIANYTPPVAVIVDERANAPSISESVTDEKQQTPTASSEYNSPSAQVVEPAPESSVPLLESSTSAPETPSAHSEESGAQTAQSIPPTASDASPSKSQETESTPTPSAASSANEGSSDSSSEAHFNDYDTPEQQDAKEYVLNTSTNKVHRPTCSDVKKIKPENYSTIKNLANALNNGYVPCKRCSPN